MTTLVWFLFGLSALREATTDTYVELVDRVQTTPCLQAPLELDDELAGPLAPTTVCEAENRVTTTCWRTVLGIMATVFSLSGICAIYASGFDRSAASRRFERRSDSTIGSLKMTLLVDVKSLTSLDVHCSIAKPHDIQIGLQVIKWNQQNPAVDVLLGDKAYDWSDLRDRCRDAGIRPVIKPREFTSFDQAQRPT